MTQLVGILFVVCLVALSLWIARRLPARWACTIIGVGATVSSALTGDTGFNWFLNGLVCGAAGMFWALWVGRAEIVKES